MKRQFYRRRLLALSTTVLLGLSSLFPSIAGATEITAEEPAVTDTVDPAASTDTSDPASADTVETADGKQPKKPLNRNAWSRMPTSSRFSPTTLPTGHRDLPSGQNLPW